MFTSGKRLGDICIKQKLPTCVCFKCTRLMSKLNARAECARAAWFPEKSLDSQESREFKKWRRQRPRQRHKSMIWMVEWGKIILLHMWHAFWCNFWRSLQENVKFSYLKFWWQRKYFSFSSFTWKPFVPKKPEVHFACFVKRYKHGIIVKTLNLMKSSILTSRFHCSNRRSFLNSLVLWMMLAIRWKALRKVKGRSWSPR